jgi:hypothetical protein
VAKPALIPVQVAFPVDPVALPPLVEAWNHPAAMALYPERLFLAEQVGEVQHSRQQALPIRCPLPNYLLRIHPQTHHTIHHQRCAEDRNHPHFRAD